MKNKIKYPKRKYDLCKISVAQNDGCRRNRRRRNYKATNKKARQDIETRRREMSMKNNEEKDAAGNSDIDDVHDGTECYSDE